jgi:hypothetical protein
MLFEHMAPVHADNYIKPRTRVLIIVRAVGTYSYHSALED